MTKVTGITRTTGRPRVTVVTRMTEMKDDWMAWMTGMIWTTKDD